MPDDERAIFEPFLTAATGRPPGGHRRVPDGIFWLARAGAGRRDLPEEFGNWNPVFRQFRRWAESGVFDVMPEGFADSGGDLDMPQMIDGTVIRAHRCAAGQKGGFKIRRRAAPRAAFQRRPTCG
jgi:transposase